MGKHNRNLTWYVKLADDTEVKVKGIETPEAAMEKVKMDMSTSDSPAPVSARPARVYKKKDQPSEETLQPFREALARDEASDDVPVE